MNSRSYKLSRDQLLLKHFPANSAMLGDGVSDPHHDLIVKVRSGEYFGSLAMQLENLCADPYIDFETFKYILGKFSEDLLYLQDTHKIMLRKTKSTRQLQ